MHGEREEEGTLPSRSLSPTVWSFTFAKMLSLSSPIWPQLLTTMNVCLLPKGFLQIRMYTVAVCFRNSSYINTDDVIQFIFTAE